jgi:CspA family cold shock protein
MGKGRDYRGPRRRGFDDDTFSMNDIPPAPMGRHSDPSQNSVVADSPAIDATVKWFNSEKGFGFVALADGSGDAFLHMATLEAAGFDALEPGTKLRVQAGQGPKGRQVTAVLEVSSGPPSPANRTAIRQRSDIPELSDSATTEVHGTVKWFNSVKGFGFVGTEDGGKDVFVHITLLEKEGLREIAEGQKVVMRVQQRQKGREAISIKVMP